jgi:citrate lyase subunit beta/citryl-CoA lyase
VRLHDPGHAAWKQDVDIVVGEAGADLAYLTIPKPVSYEQSAAAVDYIQMRAHAAGVKVPPLHLLIETQSALRDVFRLASLPGVETLISICRFVPTTRIAPSAMRSPGQFTHRLITRAKAEVAAAALANGRVPTHNPCLVLDDPRVPRQDAETARREYGFLRMYSIHPGQIQPIVEAMAPAQEDVARATEILLAAQAADRGPVSHRGEMHDRASYRLFGNWSSAPTPPACGSRRPP